MKNEAWRPSDKVVTWIYSSVAVTVTVVVFAQNIYQKSRIHKNIFKFVEIFSFVNGAF